MMDDYCCIISNKPKARCVASDVFYTDRGAQSFADQIPSSIPKEKLDEYLRRRRRSYANSDRDRIIRNVSWGFDKVALGQTVGEGRFNSKHEAALYTARDAQTAMKERLHYVKEGSKPFDYVVFAIFASAKMVDIRKGSGNSLCLVVADNHQECQRFASDVREKYAMSTGIIPDSVRDPGGACCTFFT
ncbi:RES family NAD+ phosphorylase [Pseudoroseicyclus tamaricis]|uniref:RES family NAD+ phosphorylase n=1 Tax=Pseudoroseicyclus tamaricis TaxID=2705421 RepID=A0A6B2JGY0_9RHOB|nr:RES family NAD+ phosphorylase [Pseudoroseicyclus tamaricis]NDV00491.1 RES family NAD+ phosphorylase [Pseudoroseicyclus tamaricis]